MKRGLILIGLCFFLLLSACSTPPSPESAANCYFYYLNPADGSFYAHPASLDLTLLSPEELLEHYLAASTPELLSPCIPGSWALSSASMDGSTALLEFAGSTVSEIERSLSLSCLSLTLLQHPQVNRLSITAPGEENPTILTADDILLKDTGMLPQEEQVVLYLPDPQRRYLTSVSRSMDAQEAANPPDFILRQLLDEDSAVTCIPPNTKLLSVSVENGVCTVDLSSEFEQNMESSFATIRMAVYSIVNSLTELPEISTVDFWVSGAPLESLYVMDLANGVARDDSLLSTPADEDYLDITLYPTCGDEGLLAAVPVTIELTENAEIAEQAIHTLIGYEGRNGIENCIPSGTKLLSLRMENNVCIVDFTGEFLNGCANDLEETLAVRSVIATLCALDGISAVEILVEGIEPNYRDNALSRSRQPQENWFVN